MTHTKGEPESKDRERSSWRHHSTLNFAPPLPTNERRDVSGVLNLHFARIANFCIRHAWLIIVATVLLGAGGANDVARHFALNTDTRNLLSPRLPWRKRDLAIRLRSRSKQNRILAVVTAPTPEFEVPRPRR